jgi:hypothetical protein
VEGTDVVNRIGPPVAADVVGTPNNPPDVTVVPRTLLDVATTPNIPLDATDAVAGSVPEPEAVTIPLGEGNISANWDDVVLAVASGTLLADDRADIREFNSLLDVVDTLVAGVVLVVVPNILLNGAADAA